MKKIAALFFFLFFFLGQASSQNLPPELIRYADMVLYGGKVLTADKDTPDFTVAEAVALRDGRILAVGNSQAMLRFAGPSTVKVDLKGKTVVPGFVSTDADNAFAAGDWYKYNQVGDKLIGDGERILVKPETKEGIFARVREIAASAKAGDPIYLTFDKGETGQLLELTRTDLDKLTAKNPLAITMGGSDIVVNTKLLELAFANGLKRDMFGVVKDAKGEPTGQLFSRAAGIVMWNLRPYPAQTFRRLLDYYPQLQHDLAEAGITALTGHATGLDLTVWNLLYHQNRLYLRFRPAMDVFRSNPLAEQFIARVGNLVDFGLGDTVKIIGAALGPADSGIDDPYSISNHEAMKLVPDSEWGADKGDQFPNGALHWVGEELTGKHSFDELTPEEKKGTEWQTLIDMRRIGWNFQGIHNMGSRATEVFLRGLEEAVKDKDKLLLKETFRPHGLDHNIIWNKLTIDLAKKAPEPIRFGLAIREFFQPRKSLTGKDIIWLKFPADKVPQLQPVKPLIDQGIVVNLEIGGRLKTLGSRYDPRWLLQSLITRKDYKGRDLGQEYAVDRKTALLMATRWGAKFIGEEKEIGAIAPGMHADLVVIGDDYLTMPAEKMAKMPLVMTIIGGKIVFTDAKYAKELGPEHRRALHPALQSNP